MTDFVSRRELADALRQFDERLTERIIPQELARLHMRTTIKSVSTADKDRGLLVDSVAAYVSGINGSATTQLWRLEMAGHLTVPRMGEPAATFGDLRNGSYLPVGSAKYRPKGGQPGDVASYSLATDKPAVTWWRADGSSSWTSGGGATIELDKSTKDVKVNGGTKKVSRVGDRAKGKIRVSWVQTTMTSFTMTISIVNKGGITVIAAFTAAGAVSVPPAPGVAVDTEIESELFEGAPNFYG